MAPQHFNSNNPYYPYHANYPPAPPTPPVPVGGVLYPGLLLGLPADQRHPLNAANSSYWFGNDSEFGWGERYFFTFYTEGGDRRPWAILEASVFAVIFLVSVVANVSIAAAVLRYREMRTVTNCFLLNLAAADLVFALGSPLVAVARLTPEWPLGDTACRLLPYSQVSSNPDPAH